MTVLSRTKAIAKLNDEFRNKLTGPEKGSVGSLGKGVWTKGIYTQSNRVKSEILRAIAEYDFIEGNDPYGEHDYGVIDHPEAGKYCWRIDCYEDEKCQYGALNPELRNSCFRVLTIMLLEEV